MAITLKVTPKELEAKAGSITASIDEIEKELGAIETIIVGMKKYWQGDASDQHQKNYQKFKNDIPTVITKLREHPKDLLKMAEIYDAAEDYNKEFVKQLPVNPIV
ncbi:MAG: WXG100 family type VII secretion target [Agathobacter sp.]|nr:WXG100 family type VII secretion target [Agathobacter sp.]